MKLQIGHVNFFILIFFSLFNFITLLIGNRLIIDYLFYVLPFVIIGIIYFFLNRNNKSHKINALLFVVVGLFATISGQRGNATGIIFICFSLYIYNSYKTNLIITGLTIIAFITKYIILDLTVMNIFSLMMMYAYVLTIYYLLIHPKKTEMIKDPKISEQNREILQYLVAGYQYKEIANLGNIYFSADAMRQRITRVRRDFDCVTDLQLIYKLLKQGYFK